LYHFYKNGILNKKYKIKIVEETELITEKDIWRRKHMKTKKIYYINIKFQTI
jgi:hypothetical protein